MRIRNAVAAILGLAGVLGAASLRAEEVEVRIANFTFEPSVLTVEAGTKVRWKNDDDSPHSIVDPAAGLRSRALDTEEIYERTFADPGTFAYVCGLHPQMKGKIIVRPRG